MKNLADSLKLIPKYEEYIEYMFNILEKLPKVEKYNIGNEYKVVMYGMLNNIMYLNKVERKEKLKYCNRVDADITVQRVFIRIMYKEDI